MVSCFCFISPFIEAESELARNVKPEREADVSVLAD